MSLNGPESGDAAPDSARLDRRVWILASGTFAVGTEAHVISGLLNQLAGDFGVGLEEAGLIASAYAVTYAASAPFLAALFTRVSRRVVAAVALLVFALANALCALAPSFDTLIAARILAGIAAGLYLPTAYGLGAALARAGRQGATLAAVALGTTTSIVVGVPVGVMISQWLGWRETFWAIAALSVGVAVASHLRLDNLPLPKSPGRGFTQRFSPLFSGRTLRALLPTVLGLSAAGATFTYLGAMLNAHGHSTAAIAGAFLLFGLGGLVGSQAGGRLTDRFGLLRPTCGAVFLGAVASVLLAYSLADAVLSAATIFAFAMMPWPLVLAQQQRLIALAPEHGDVMLALNNSSVYLGMAAGAGIGGMLLASGAGLASIPLASAVLFILALAAFIVAPDAGRMTADGKRRRRIPRR